MRWPTKEAKAEVQLSSYSGELNSLIVWGLALVVPPSNNSIAELILEIVRCCPIFYGLVSGPDRLNSISTPRQVHIYSEIIWYFFTLIGPWQTGYPRRKM